jgi:ABC-type antimicrobial peptide transport system permease subunit
VEGRTFTDEEFRNAQADVVIVSRALARRMWPRDSALDRRLSVVTAGGLEAFRVVGVVPDIVYEEIGEETEQSRLIVYMPYSRVAPRTMALMVRTAGGADASVAAIRSIMRQRFPGVPAYDLRTMAQIRTYTTWEQRIFGEVMAGFAIVAVALAWLGVYGLVAYTVARRTREIGLRMALGAHRYDVVKMVMSDVAATAAAGVGLGMVLGAAVARTLEGSVYGVDVRDPRLLVTAALTMATAVFAAALWPARRATRIEPTVALRCD